MTAERRKNGHLPRNHAYPRIPSARLAQDWCWIRPEDTAKSLWFDTLLPMGLRLFEKTLADIGRGELVRIPQDESIATWEPSWERAPIPRPDLLQLGGAIDGYRVTVSRFDESGQTFSSPITAEK